MIRKGKFRDAASGKEKMKEYGKMRWHDERKMH